VNHLINQWLVTCRAKAARRPRSDSWNLWCRQLCHRIQRYFFDIRASNSWTSALGGSRSARTSPIGVT